MSARGKPPALYRGDYRDGIAVPDPVATTKIVAHILYLGGPGRATPFTSTSASKVAAEHFAGRAGRVWETDTDIVASNGASCISHDDLLNNLTGNGKGQCKWDDPFEVAQACAYVKKWKEHLVDWRAVDPPSSVAERVKRSFS